MTIAVNTKYFLRAYQPDYSKFIYECFSRIIEKQPQHTFIFIADAPFDASFTFSKNCIPVVIFPKFAKGISGLLYEIKISSLLRKYKADIYLHAGSLLSLLVKAPTCLYLYRPGHLSRNDFIKKNHLYLYKKCLPFFLIKAQSVITGSQLSKTYIIEQYNTYPKKIDVVYNGVNDDYSTIAPEEKEKVKDQYAAGNEYFIFIGNNFPQNILLNVLKGFSHLKKWQKTSMQLLIVLHDKASDEFMTSLNLFKYKSEVKLLINTSAQELKQVINAAYCMIYFSFNAPYVGTALQAIRSNVPVITDDTGLMPELCGEAVLYTNFEDAANLSDKITEVYRDENLRRQLIEKGRLKISEYSWDTASGLLWRSLVNPNA